MDLESSQYHIQSHRSNSITQSTTQFMDTSTIAYQEEIAKACGVALDKRILSFTADPPPSHNLNKLIINQSWNRPLRHITKRKIAQAPEKVLDAPG